MLSRMGCVTHASVAPAFRAGGLGAYVQYLDCLAYAERAFPSACRVSERNATPVAPLMVAEVAVQDCRCKSIMSKEPAGYVDVVA